MSNPFEYEKLATGANFCGRDLEIERVMQLVRNRKNILLFGERRYGKTSLIKYAFQQMGKEQITAFSDLFAVTSAEDVAMCLYRAITDALPFSLEEKAKSLMDFFKRVTFEIRPDRSGTSFSLTPAATDKGFEAMIHDALGGAESICERTGKRMVIALDEFQEISEIKEVRVDAILRERMQNLKHVSFIFSGSKKSVLSQLFTDRQQPLYGMASSIPLGGIEINALREYCNDFLPNPIPELVFEQLYTMVRGQTKLIMQTCFWLYERETEPTEALVMDVIDQIIDEKNEEFKMLFDHYSTADKKVIKLMASAGGKNVFAKDNTDAISTTKQKSLQAIKKLQSKGDVLSESSGDYYLTDVHFWLWCLKQFQRA